MVVVVVVVAVVVVAVVVVAVVVVRDFCRMLEAAGAGQPVCLELPSECTDPFPLFLR